jgi:hypothetical protein
MDSKPRRRWWQFRLRTLLIAVAVVSIPLTWVGYQLNWIRERHRALDNRKVTVMIWPDDGMRASRMPPPPWSLRLFGESHMAGDLIGYDLSESEVARLRGLFPENPPFNASRDAPTPPGPDEPPRTPP